MRLILQGLFLARDLRGEGRDSDADTVLALLQLVKEGYTQEPVESLPYLTTGQVAQRIGVSRQTVVNWVKKGLLPGKRVGGRTLIAPTALQDFAKIERVLDALDAERPPLTPTEAAAQVRSSRKGWVWRQPGK
jgi:excisionase family DNA binding protein